VFVSGLASPMVLCLLLAVSALGLLTLAAGRAHGWTIWLWPHRGLNGVYIRQVVVLALLLVTAVALSIRNQSLAPYLILPFLTFAAASAVYWRWLPQSCERATLTNPAWQTLSVVLFLACTVVVPSAALFRLALGQEFAKLILTEREWINAQAEDWLRETSVEALKDRYAEPRVAELQLSRARYLGCVPAPFSPPPAIYATETPAAQRPDAVPAALEAAPAKARLTPGSCGEGGASAPARATSVVQSMGIVAGLGDVLHEIDNLIPVENETLARQMFQRNGQSYSPDGTLVPSFRASGVALAGLALSFALLFWWIRWNTTNLFLADLEGSCATRPEPCEQLWQKRTRDEQMVLVQIARERFANPYQRPIVRQLLQDGLVRLAPDLQPSSEEFEKFLRGKEQKLEAQIKKWEENTGAWSWRYGRLILGASVIGVLFFLVATQPGLQSSVTAIATSIAGVLTAGSKLREAITSWFSKKS
jgi:hypothetical protein